MAKRLQRQEHAIAAGCLSWASGSARAVAAAADRPASVPSAAGARSRAHFWSQRVARADRRRPVSPAWAKALTRQNQAAAGEAEPPFPHLQRGQKSRQLQPKRDKHGEGQSLHSWRPPVLPRACKPVVHLSNCDRPRCRLAGASCRCHRSSTAPRQPRGLRLPVPLDDMQITCGVARQLQCPVLIQPIWRLRA